MGNPMEDKRKMRVFLKEKLAKLLSSGKFTAKNIKKLKYQAEDIYASERAIQKVIDQFCEINECEVGA